MSYKSRIRPRPREVSGADHPETQFALWPLAMTRFTEAEAALTESLRLREGTLEPDDWRLANLRNQIGAAAGHLGRFEEAEPLLVESAEWMRTSPTMPSIQETRRDLVGEGLERVAEFYEAWHAADPDRGHAVTAAEWRTRLAEWTEAIGGR